MTTNECPEDAPEWFRRWLDLTPEQIDAMAAEYAQEQIDSAKSEAAFDAAQKEHRQ